MKAIGIKMVELQPMRASMALSTGYKIGNAHPDDMGYEVTYPDGYKSWTPKDVADAAYYPLSENNDGTKILKEDVENFITNVDKYPSHIQRVITEYEELNDKIDKLNTFINGPIFRKLNAEERNDMACQLTSMRNYSDILLSRLTRAGVDFKELI